MTTIGIPCALLPAVALRVIDDLCAVVSGGDWWAEHLGKRCFAVLRDQTIFHGRIISRRHGLAVVCRDDGFCREVHPRFVWSTEGWPS